MTTLTLELPEKLFSDLKRSPEEVEKDVRLAAAIEWYRTPAPTCRSTSRDPAVGPRQG